MKSIKPGRLTNRSFSLVFIIVLLIILIEEIIGAFINVNTLVFFTYLAFLYFLYSFDTRFILEYLWLVVSASLNLLGNYICDTQEVYLIELGRTTSYMHSFTPLVLVYVILFSVLEIIRLKKGFSFASIKSDEQNRTNNANTKTLKIILLIGIVIVAVLFASVYSTPYFSVGAARLLYAQDYMGQFQRSIKTYLPMFMPIAIMYGRASKKKLLPIIFFVLTVLFYFWVGDKFGTYFFAIYIVAVSLDRHIEEKQLKRLSIVFFSLIVLLLLIVFAYRVLLYNENRSLFLEYLMQRLAQQGEVWWSVFAKESGSPLKIAEFGEEIKSILPFGNADNFVGQWKMMLVASNYSSYASYRIEVGNPYTSTTTASIFYYFRWPGIILFYTFCGLFYGRLVQHSVQSVRDYRILETMICIKLFTSFHDLLFASDLYLISYKGIIYIFLLYVLVYMRKKHIKLVLYER